MLGPNITGDSGLNDTYHNELDQTAAALEGGVTSLAPSTAIDVIDVWHGTLKNAEKDSLHYIANLLAELKDELQADRLDGRAIGGLMLRLGEGTTSAAADANDARMTPKLERLGILLTRAGTVLGAEPTESNVAADSDPTTANVAQTEKGLNPDPSDQNPGKSTDRAQ